MKNKGKGIAPSADQHTYTTVWYVRSMFSYSYEDVLDPLRTYHGKYCVKKFVEYITEHLKQLHSTFLQQPMTELAAILKRKYKIKICISVSKSFSTQIIVT